MRDLVKRSTLSPSGSWVKVCSMSMKLQYEFTRTVFTYLHNLNPGLLGDSTKKDGKVPIVFV